MEFPLEETPMKYTNSPWRTTLSRSPVETTDPIADELRRFDDPLRDVTGRAADVGYAI